MNSNHDRMDSAGSQGDESGTALPVIEGAPNPQGKGQVGFLTDWVESSPRAFVAKQPARLLADYFTSLLVLSAEFRFKPVPGQTYHLYRVDREWQLSLISPEEWRNNEKSAGYVGACELHDDATWSIEPSDNLGRPGPVTEALAAVYESFLAKLDSKQPLEEELPVYEGRLPYYQRLFAAALGRSIEGSMRVGGQTGVRGDAWLQSLPRSAERMMRSLTDER
jgi:hypothetical protein